MGERVSDVRGAGSVARQMPLLDFAITDAAGVRGGRVVVGEVAAVGQDDLGEFG